MDQQSLPTHSGPMIFQQIKEKNPKDFDCSVTSLVE